MNMRRRSGLSSVAVLILAIPLWAHHGVSAYDMTQVTTVNGGVVTDFEFVNPHVQITWEVKDDQGAVQKWTAEGTTPNILYRYGWNKDTLNPGTQLKAVSGNRCKSGQNCMRLRSIALADGTELPIPQ
jgi:hypothetical protein